MLHTGFLSWQRNRHRRLQRCFASLGLFNRSPTPGNTSPVNPDASASKDKKKDEQSKEQKGRGESKDKAEEQAKPGKVPLGQLLKEKQEELAEEKPEKPLAARIVAYSDSEGEDEPFRLTRRRKKKSSEEEQTEAEDDKEESPSSSGAPGLAQSLPKPLGERRLLRAARSCTRRGLTRLREEAGWGLLLQIFLMWFARRRRRKATRRFELLTLAISLPDALSCLMGLQCPSQRLPRRLHGLLCFLESWARPAALFQLEEAAQVALPKKKRRRVLTTISQSVRIFQEAELEAPSPSSRPVSSQQPRLAAESAALYKVELAEMKRILDSQGVKLPGERFDDTQAELLRFATTAGLLQAGSHEEKAHAIQEGSQRVMKTVDWLRKHRFMPAAQLKEWHHMVRWQGTDTDGWPILVIKIAKACAECQGDAADAVAEAVVGQMQRAMTDIFSNRHGPDKLVVVMDATGANSLQAARNVALFKQVAVLLNKHCPSRLHQLFVVDLPSQLRWVLATLKPLLHPSTKEKIRIISISDPALPLPAHALQEPRKEPSEDEAAGSEPESSKRRVSIPELPVSSSPAANEGARDSVPALPNAGSARPKRRVRILELPFRELERKPSRLSADTNSIHSPGSILRPALKRSMSAGLIGIQQNEKEEAAAAELGQKAQEAKAYSGRDELD